MKPIRVESLSLRLADFELRADFRLEPGERCALVGRSGGGKTTLLRWLAGLDAGVSGRLFVADREVTGLPPEARGFGVVFQEQALFPALSVEDNASFGLRMRGQTRADSRRAAREWLARVGLEERARSGVDTLSGGERQRLAFVRAMIWRPELVLLDEPFSALDAANRERLRAALLELHREWAAPVLLVSHDEADVAGLATSRLVLDESVGGRERRFAKRPEAR